MNSPTQTFKKLALSGIATVILILGGLPGQITVTSQLKLGQLAWGENDSFKTQDRDALEALYHALGGEGWKRSDGWLTPAPLDEWYGLRVSNGRVIFLELDDNNLTGEIPPEIDMLDRLYVLDLRWNSISGGLDGLKKLPKLAELRLTANNLNGPIPESIAELTSLRRLELSENDFSGEIPIQIGKLLKLEAFAAHSNELTGEIPKELCQLRRLKRLVLSENKLSGSIADILKHCDSLQHINFAHNQLAGEFSVTLPQLKRLNWLDLRGNKFSETQEPTLLINFPGIYIQTEQLAELGGLAMWGKGSSLYATEDFRLAVVRYLSAISIDKGLLSLAESRVPADFLDQAKELVNFVNSYLQESGERIHNVSDLERLIAKGEKHSLTKALKTLG